VEKTLGWTVEIVRRPRKPAPEEVLMAWAKQWAREGVMVDWQELLPPAGISGPAATLGCGENVCLALSEPSDEQGLRAAACYE
jgi:hypothetical protein